MGKRLHVILGDQLFPLETRPIPPGAEVFMAEDRELCSQPRHHQQKIILFLSAMRSYADALRDAGHKVHYRRLDDPGAWQESYVEGLIGCIRSQKISTASWYEISDRKATQKLTASIDQEGVPLEVLPSPGFLTSTDELRAWFEGRKTLRLHDFYVWQRKRLQLLMGPAGVPMGGRWSFDSENRKALPSKETPPDPKKLTATAHTLAVTQLVKERFAEHFGNTQDFNWPTTRQQALDVLNDFLDLRLQKFGDYQDALTNRHDTVYHSLLSPALNLGLITPTEVVTAIQLHLERAPLASIEGFLRQVIGWREFLKGVDVIHGETQHQGNHWNHHRKLAPCWWTGETGLPPLDDLITKTRRTGYGHHIERLMVAGNVMLLAGIAPQEAYRWFMECFIDSADWVMGPNVFGMALYSDGGLFATKPYICASSYWCKMGRLKKGPWADGLDGLYWRFIGLHREELAANQRTRAMTWGLDRLSSERKKIIMTAGEGLMKHLTQ